MTDLFIRRYLFSFAAVALVAFASPTRAEDARFLDIPAQPLSSALIELSRQTDVVVVADPAVVNGHQAPALQGTYTPAQALDHLLAGSGLTAARRSDGSFTLSRPGASSAPLGTAQEALPPEIVLVTGTRIRGVAPDSSPLSIYDRADIERTGVGSVGQFLRTLPENFANVDPGTSLGSNNNSGQNFTEGSSIDLHGVGPGATLVLVNGHRIAPSGLNGSLVDVSMLPLSAIERVEILSDGASALYGADAIAGVVNFILRRDFEGAETSLRYGASADGGGREVGASQLFGGSWSSGGAMLVLDVFDQDSLKGTQRDFIPAFAADYELLPSQHRDSGYLSLHHDFTPTTSLSFDASFSEREFENSYTDAVQSVLSDGKTESSSGALTVRQELGDGWQLAGDLSYGLTESELTQNYITFDFVAESGIRSEVATLDLRADGPLFDIPGGPIRASVGIQARDETFDDLTTAIPSVGTNLNRDVRSAYGELFVPVLGIGEQIRGANRLELSIAGRYDDYDDVGSDFSPRVGVLWSPLAGLNLRATYAESFRAAPLAQLADGNESFFALALPDPSSPTGLTNTILSFAPGNPDLRPEQSQSWTVGFDWSLPSPSAVKVGVTYFHIDYEDRIANPPTTFTDLYTLGNALDPYIDRNPSDAEIEAIFSHPSFFNPSGLAESDIGTIYDHRLQNIGVSLVEGIDASASYSLDALAGVLTFSGAITHTLDNSLTAAAGLDAVDVFDRFSYPVQTRFRGGVDWSNGRFGGSLLANYAGAYDNDLVLPVEEIDSWLTFDAQLVYQSAEAQPGFRVTLTLQNLFNEDPPGFNFPPGTAFLNYDAANASPMGRFVSLQVSKHW
jgi:iron complex outermembrane receptor protein